MTKKLNITVGVCKQLSELCTYCLIVKANGFVIVVHLLIESPNMVYRHTETHIYLTCSELLPANFLSILEATAESSMPGDLSAVTT